MKNKYPKYCCQKCGADIGYIGRFLGFIRFPDSHHHGNSLVEIVWYIIMVGTVALVVFHG